MSEQKNPERIRVLLVDDHYIIRQGIASLLESSERIHVVGQADSGPAALDFIAKQRVDVVLMDIDMPGMSGVEVTEYIVEHHPQTRVLVLSIHDEEKFIAKVSQAGAHGYMLKNISKEHLLQAIEMVAQGQYYFSREVLEIMMNNLASSDGEDDDEIPSKRVVFTPREMDVIRLIAAGRSNAEIAEQLYISTRTVDTHRRNILQKVGVTNAAALVRYVTEQNLI